MAVKVLVKELIEKLVRESVEASVRETTEAAVEQGIKQAIRSSIGQIVEQYGRSGVRELAQQLTSETAETLVKNMTQESAETLAGNLLRSSATEFLQKLTTESASEFVEKLGREGMENFVEKLGVEGTQNLVEKMSAQAAGAFVEKLSKESLESVVAGMSRESAEKLIGKLGKEGIETLTEKLGKEGTEKLAASLSRESAERLTGKAVQETSESAARLASLERTRRYQRMLFAGSLIPAAGLYMYARADDAWGGKLTNELISAAASSVKSTIQNLDDVDRQTISDAIHGCKRVVDWVVPDDLVQVQTGLIRGVVELNADDPDLLNIVKKEAIGIQLIDWARFSIYTAVRGTIYNDEEMFPDLTADERDRLLAEGLIDDMLHGANRTVPSVTDMLREKGLDVTEDDVRLNREDVGKFIQEHPEVIARIPVKSVRDRIINGLVQIYPDLEDELRASAEQANRELDKAEQEARQAVESGAQRAHQAAGSIGNLSHSSLSEVFNIAADNSGVMGLVFKGISWLAGLFGESARAAVQSFALSQFDADVRLAALREAASDGDLVTRNGDPFEVTRVQQPAPGGPTHLPQPVP